MRHSADRGRHSRPPRVPLRSYLLAGLALLAAVIAAAGLARTNTARAAVAVPAASTHQDATAQDASWSLATARTVIAAVREQARQVAAVRAAANAAAALAAHTYTVRSGDSIGSIALRRCSGQSRDWTGIYAASRVLHWTAKNANNLTIGQRLYLNCAYDASQLRFAPAPPPPPAPVPVPVPVRAVAAVATASTGTGYSAPVQYRAPAATYSAAAGSYQQCVITRESGGNSQVMNSSGHYGLYQFDYGTWVSGGGAGGDFGHASVAEQNRVFAAVYAARGTQPWSPSDGC